MTSVKERLALRSAGLKQAPKRVEVKVSNQGALMSVEDENEFYRDPVAVLGSIAEISPETSKQMFEIVRYQGFDKESFIESWAIDHGFTALDMVKVAFIAAIRGTAVERLREVLSSQKLSLSKPAQIVAALSDGSSVIKNPSQRLTVKGRKAVTMQRCSAVVPHIVAAIMKRAKVPPRYPSLQLPAHLQFPAAAALPLNPERRRQHKEFNDIFSAAISQGRGISQQRQESIYNQQVSSGIAPLTMPLWVAEELQEDLAAEYLSEILPSGEE